MQNWYNIFDFIVSFHKKYHRKKKKKTQIERRTFISNMAYIHAHVSTTLTHYFLTFSLGFSASGFSSFTLVLGTISGNGLDKTYFNIKIKILN